MGKGELKNIYSVHYYTIKKWYFYLKNKKLIIIDRYLKKIVSQNLNLRQLKENKRWVDYLSLVIMN